MNLNEIKQIFWALYPKINPMENLNDQSRHQTIELDRLMFWKNLMKNDDSNLFLLVEDLMFSCDSAKERDHLTSVFLSLIRQAENGALSDEEKPLSAFEACFLIESVASVAEAIRKKSQDECDLNGNKIQEDPRVQWLDFFWKECIDQGWMNALSQLNYHMIREAHYDLNELGLEFRQKMIQNYHDVIGARWKMHEKSVMLGLGDRAFNKVCDDQGIAMWKRLAFPGVDVLFKDHETWANQLKEKDQKKKKYPFKIHHPYQRVYHGSAQEIDDDVLIYNRKDVDELKAFVRDEDQNEYEWFRKEYHEVLEVIEGSKNKEDLVKNRWLMWMDVFYDHKPFDEESKKNIRDNLKAYWIDECNISIVLRNWMYGSFNARVAHMTSFLVQEDRVSQGALKMWAAFCHDLMHHRHFEDLFKDHEPFSKDILKISQQGASLHEKFQCEEGLAGQDEKVKRNLKL